MHATIFQSLPYSMENLETVSPSEVIAVYSTGREQIDGSWKAFLCPFTPAGDANNAKLSVSFRSVREYCNENEDH